MANTEKSIRIHDTALVETGSEIGEGTSIWNWAQIRSGAKLGMQCIVGKGVFVDSGVTIGNRVKIQNHVSIFRGVTVEDGVFVGPHVCFTNDLTPRAITPDGELKNDGNWLVTATLIKHGASIGANSTIRCGITVGKWAMIGAGSVVTKDVPDFALVLGSPARNVGFVCFCGLRREKPPAEGSTCTCK
jgi:UDP-2-acetamido-3-amino-2,3-dideoxy-glucuronate N-acetyltransferase